MKKIVLFISFASLILSCNNAGQKAGETDNNISDDNNTPAKTEQVKDKTFDELFKKIEATELTDNIFKLVGEDFTVITAGDETHYNSMTASWGGVGILFNNPATWCFLRANRYTLELMKKHETYTMAYFPEEYKDRVMYLGSVTGRNTDKMKNTTLTYVKTHDGNIAYKEAKLIIECKLIELTTVNPSDFYTEKGKSFIEEAYTEVKDYHKIVLGQITSIWVSK
ncbi:MAG: flavin reductase [Prevotellaceae bacterium]|jgi:flavin reductase (DIM6/NTAB) family NADH-FMN oxidoreductase RutF|nr:flavin reductase [Prevotellaceae bacterium]